MARRRGPGRPRNTVPSRVIGISLTKPDFDLITTIGRVEGLSRSTWCRRELMRALDKHSKRVAKL